MSNTVFTFQAAAEFVRISHFLVKEPMMYALTAETKAGARGYFPRAPLLAAAFDARAGGTGAKDAGNARPGARVCPSCRHYQCVCPAEADTEAAEDAAGQDGGADAGSFDLRPGYTSFRDRLSNLIRAGHAGKAVDLIALALEEADERTIGDITEAALDTHAMLLRSGANPEAERLRLMLEDWGVEAVPDHAPVWIFSPSPSILGSSVCRAGPVFH